MKLKGSYTIEAALIMSILIPLLTAVIYLGFYVHNKAVLEAAACRIVSLGCMEASEEKACSRMENAKGQVLSENIIGITNLQGEISADGTCCRAAFYGDFYVPGLIMRFFSQNRIEVKAVRELKIVHPVETIRKVRSIEKLLEGLG